MTFQKNIDHEHNHGGEHGLDDPAAIEAIIAGAADAVRPRDWHDLKKAVLERDDVKPILEAMDGLRELDAKLRPAHEAKLPPERWQYRAAYRVRWALAKQAGRFDLSNFARALLPWVLDTIHREGFVGWENWQTFATALGKSVSYLSEAVTELEKADLIRRTLGHRNRLVWSGEQDLLVTGNRGPSYTFGLAGFGSFCELLDGVELRNVRTSDEAEVATVETSSDHPPSRSSECPNFTDVEVRNTRTSEKLKFGSSRKQEEPLSSFPNEPNIPNELKGADAPSATSATRKAVEVDEVLAGEIITPTRKQNGPQAEPGRAETCSDELLSDETLKGPPLSPSRAGGAITVPGFDLGSEVMPSPRQIDAVMRKLDLSENDPLYSVKVEQARDEYEKCLAQWDSLSINPKTGRRQSTDKNGVLRDMRYSSAFDWFRFAWADNLKRTLVDVAETATAKKYAHRKPPEKHFGKLVECSITWGDVYETFDALPLEWEVSEKMFVDVVQQACAGTVRYGFERKLPVTLGQIRDAFGYWNRERQRVRDYEENLKAAEIDRRERRWAEEFDREMQSIDAPKLNDDEFVAAVKEIFGGPDADWPF